MLSKKKKNLEKRTKPKGVITLPKGLFAHQESKNNLIEQFKRGTLFSVGARRDESHLTQHKRFTEQSQNWINQIRLEDNFEDDFSCSLFSNQLPQKSHLLKHLPTISHCNSIRKPTKKIIERKCNKNICFQRKLMTLGAWNKENKSGIDNNIDKLAKTMDNSKEYLIKNDFQRLEKKSFKVDGSFDRTMISVNEDMSMIEKNPFSSLPHCNRIGRIFGQSKTRQNFFSSSNKNKYQTSEGDKVPAFLLNRLTLDNWNKIKIKHKY